MKWDNVYVIIEQKFERCGRNLEMENILSAKELLCDVTVDNLLVIAGMKITISTVLEDVDSYVIIGSDDVEFTIPKSYECRTVEGITEFYNEDESVIIGIENI